MFDLNKYICKVFILSLWVSTVERWAKIQFPFKIKSSKQVTRSEHSEHDSVYTKLFSFII